MMFEEIKALLVWCGIILVLFTALYTLYLFWKFHRHKSLTVHRDFLGFLFSTELSLAEASAGENGDLSVNNVIFEGNFGFRELIEAVQKIELDRGGLNDRKEI